MATKIDISGIVDGLQSTETKAQKAIRMYATEGSKKLENYAKTHKRWINRTGHAVQRLKGYIEEGINNIKVCIAHGVDYGIFLELRYERKYAILEESVRVNAKEVLQGFKGLIEKL